jgi:hypothetical protein
MERIIESHLKSSPERRKCHFKETEKGAYPGPPIPIELCVVKNSQVCQDGSDSFYCESGDFFVGAVTSRD